MNAQPWCGDFVIEQDGDMSVKLSDRRIVHGHNFEVLGGIFETCNCRRLCLNFSNVETISSNALGRLMALNRQIEAAGGRLILSQMNPALFRVFQVARLDILFDIRLDGDATLNQYADQPHRQAESLPV